MYPRLVLFERSYRPGLEYIKSFKNEHLVQNISSIQKYEDEINPCECVERGAACMRHSSPL